MRLTHIIRLPLLLATLACCVSVAPASTQIVRGRVIDLTTGSPIIAGSVLLLDLTGQVQKLAVTNATGVYSIQVPSPGSYTLRVDATGYNRHNEPQFAVLAGRILELDVSLLSYIELPLVVVEADSVPYAPGPLEGFYERKERGRGQFITGEQIEMMGVPRFTDIVRLTVGVEVISMGGSQYSIRIKGTGRLGGCAPQFWVDNVRWGTVDLEGEGPDRSIYPYEIAGIEIYRPSAVPIEFAAFDLSCGAVVVWTRRAP